MANKFVKRWDYECIVSFETTSNSVEQLAMMKNPPDDASCVVKQDDLRFLKSTVKEVNQIVDIPAANREDKSSGKAEKKSSLKNKQDQK